MANREQLAIRAILEQRENLSRGAVRLQVGVAGSVPYKVLRNAIKTFLSSGERFRPKAWPVTARILTP